MSKYFEDMIGQDVELWPNLSTSFKATLLEVNEHGFVFRLTSHTRGLSPGELYFVSHSQGLKFKVCNQRDKTI